MKGHRVVLDGTEVEVTGLDVFPIMCSPEDPYTQTFGMMVRPECGLTQRSTPERR